MRTAFDCLALLLVFLATGVLNAAALDVPFAEGFASDAAGWTDSGNTSFLTHTATGGPDGGAHVSTQFAFASGGGAGGSSAVLFRGQDEFDASGGAFVGDWNGDGVRRLSAQVRHDAPLPLSFFTRMSGPLNFPGSVAVAFAPVPPNQWTTVEFDVSPTSSQLVSFEGADYAAVFSNIGHVQFGASIPAALAADTTLYTFGLDNVSIDIPEPGSVVLIVLACAAAGGLLLRW
jgi:hypothetical protein